MEKITLKVDNAPDVSFTGNMIARVDKAGKNNEIWLLFETEKGHWLYVVLNMYGSLTEHVVIENRNPAELIDKLKYSEHAKSLYQKIGLDYTTKLDI